jgi:toxin HigB-1
MLYPRRIKHKGLRQLFVEDDVRRLKPEWVAKLRRIVAALNVITSPDEMDMPGYDFHELQGNRKGTYALLVSRNWRVTFEWDSEGPYNVDLEDYHGR